MIVEDKRSRISVDEARREIQLFKDSQQQPPATPPVVVLSSTGPSAEYQGDCLGVYEYQEEYNNSPAYRHTINIYACFLSSVLENIPIGSLSEWNIERLIFICYFFASGVLHSLV